MTGCPHCAITRCPACRAAAHDLVLILRRRDIRLRRRR